MHSVESQSPKNIRKMYNGRREIFATRTKEGRVSVYMVCLETGYVRVIRDELITLVKFSILLLLEGGGRGR